MAQAQDLSRLGQALLEPCDDLLQANDHDEETARYEAELEFFDCRTNQADELMRRIVQERCRSDYERSSNAISLKGIPARRYIAAERLFQQQVMTIQGVDTTGSYPTVYIGLKNGSGEYDRNRGPREKYHVYAGDHPCPIELQHQSPPGDGQSAVRVGFKYTHYVPAYPDVKGREGIVTALEEYLRDLNGDRERFVQRLRQMCATHSVQCEVLQGYEYKKRSKLLQIMFHILDNEPSQFQSACFTVGDDFKFGMTVSFARLVKLFRDGHISLKQIFLENCASDEKQIGSQGRCGKVHYALYSTYEVLKNKREIRSTCQKIDVLYSKKYRLSLNKVQALQDLDFLYGNGSVDDLCAMLEHARLDDAEIQGTADTEETRPQQSNSDNNGTHDVEDTESGPQQPSSSSNGDISQDDSQNEQEEIDSPGLAVSIRELQQENASLKEKNDELETRLRQLTPENPERADAVETGDHTEYNIGGRSVSRAALDEVKLNAHIKCVIKNFFTPEEMQNCTLTGRGSGRRPVPPELLRALKDHVLEEFNVPDQKKQEVEKKIEDEIRKKFGTVRRAATVN